VDLAVIDAKTKDVTARLAVRPERLGTVPETQLAWAAVGRRVHAIEPRSGAAIGQASLARAPSALVADPVRHRLVAISNDRIECASGRPQFAWRLGSVIAGAAMVGLVALLALRLFGSFWAAGLASLFLAVEGLGFTMSRIAIPESYTTAFLLGAWFCVLSAFYWWGSGSLERSRAAAAAWLLGTGLCVGLGGASKWVAVYGFGAIGLLVVWDAFARGKEGLWGLGGGSFRSASLLVLCLGAVPLFVYVLTYIPYFSLGHSVGDLVRLQAQMYGYHAHLTASHPFSSPWFGWPFGYRAVFLYLGGSGAERAEIWTIPNLVVFWGGLLGLASTALEARVRRSVALVVVVLAAVVQVLPWVTVSRVLFLYHYLPVVPFLAIALAWWLVEGLRGSRHRREIAIAGAVLAVLFFVAVLPMLEGWTMPVRYLDQVRHALPWVIP
jgi:dolichyl-phosphate-mannose--protein O-mannosyl transferase